MTDDAALSRILTDAKVIACVGFSARPERPSHYVSAFLAARGKQVIPVNPGLAGQSFLGETAVASLADIPAERAVDMVDVFRRADEVPGVARAALEALPSLRVFWMQLGIRHPQAADLLRARGVEVVEDRCPRIEMPRLGL